MTEFKFVFIWLLLLLFIRNQKKYTDDYPYYVTKTSIAILAFLPVIYLVAFTEPRFDTYAYLTKFANLPKNLSGLMTLLSEEENGKLFTIFGFVIKSIFGNDKQIYRLAIVIFQSIPVIYFFRKYSERYMLSLYIFLASGFHIAYMMNGIRQFMAGAIVLASTSLLLNKKYISFVLCIIIAYYFHQVAIIMLPILLISQGEVWNFKTLGFILITVVAIYYFTSVSGAFGNTIESFGYDSSLYSNDQGSNWLRVLVAFVPVLLSLFCINKIRNDNFPIVNLAVNVSIINFCIYLVSTFTSGILIGRIPCFTATYSFLIIPYLLRNVFKKNSNNAVNFICVLCYFVFYYLQYGYL